MLDRVRHKDNICSIMELLTVIFCYFPLLGPTGMDR